MSKLNLKIAEAEISKNDPILGRLFNLQKLVLPTPRTDYFYSLCRSIIGQQVSVAAATTIFSRFESVTKVQPKNVLSLSEGQVKEIGLSRQKVSYLKDLAEHFDKDADVYNHLEGLSDEEVIDELTEIKGIGVWTAQMFLIFTLSRPDIFAPDDIGLIRAIEKLFNLNDQPSKSELVELAEKWQPFRTVASLHLWQSLNNTPA